MWLFLDFIGVIYVMMLQVVYTYKYIHTHTATYRIGLLNLKQRDQKYLNYSECNGFETHMKN